VENKTQIMQQDLKVQFISFLPKHMKWTSRSVFLHVFTYANTGL